MSPEIETTTEIGTAVNPWAEFGNSALGEGLGCGLFVFLSLAGFALLIRMLN